MVIAVIAALAAAGCFGVSSVLQQGAAHSAAADDALSWRLLADLARRPVWLLGMAAAVTSFALQALALAFGPLTLVQPVLVLELPLALPLSARLRHRRMTSREWAGIALVTVGLAAFLSAASPQEGGGEPGLGVWAIVLGAVAGVVVGCVAAGRSAAGPARASLYAAAAGCTYGLLAAVLKATADLVSVGVGHALSSWQPYALGAIGGVGLLLGQSAFQAGPLAASLPVLDAAEPIAAMLIGAFAFDERLVVGGVHLAVEVVGLTLLVSGIAVIDTSPVMVKPETATTPDGDQPASRARISSM